MKADRKLCRYGDGAAPELRRRPHFRLGSERTIHMMQRALALSMALVATIGFTLARPAPALASAHCFGKVIVYAGNDAGSSISNPIIDLGTLGSWGTQNAHFNDKTWLCQQIQHQGQFRVSAYAAVGTRDYVVAQSIYVTCTGGVTTCICPATWYANVSNVLGGVTTDGKCKKAACDGNMVSPNPPNGTPIGTWGFTWGHAFYAWGTAANGGAAHCTTSPWVGH